MAQPSKSLDLERSSNEGFYTADNTNLQSDFTIEYWAKFETAPSSAVQYVLDKWLGTGGNREHQLFFHSNGDFYHQTSSAGTATNTKNASYPTTNAGTWYHFAHVFDLSAGESTTYYATESADHTTYVALTGTETTIYNSSPVFSWFVANGDTSPSNGFDGLIHDFRIWDSERTVGELDDNFKNHSLSDSASGLLMRLRFEDDLTDSSPEGDDATGVNTPSYSTDVPDWGAAPGAPASNPLSLCNF